jgi:beta propeller repeat protein
MKPSVFAWTRLWVLASCLFLLGTEKVEAAQQYQGLCSYVKMEILQELALERIGFLATLEVTNNEGDASITDFSAMLTFEQQPLSPGDGASEASGFFFVQPPELEGITGIDGSGIIRPGETAIIRWFIIPKITAGGTEPVGLQYNVGAQLGGSIYGMQIAPEILIVIPDTITVKPEPQLEITYFQPRDVDGDDPFTPDVVETPIPFTLGVLVNNVGYGRANSVRVESEQPRIVEDLQGLQVIPRLLGTRVDDEQTNHASLTITLGDIEPGRCRKGAWDMITTLSGEFTEFKASYTHASELGGRDTSIITSMNAYFMVHEVLNDQPGRDDLLDFLADTIDDSEMIPDILYESDCITTPVNRLIDVEILNYSNLVATVRANATFQNWVYMRLDDPAQAKYPIAGVVRSDGKVLCPHNYWTNIRYREPDNAKLTYLNIFDFVALGQYEYTVTYVSPGTDVETPVTTLLFSGPYEEYNGKTYVLPETQLFFLAEDDSPVGTYYRLDAAADFTPAAPFSIPDAGEYFLEYYSEDSEGNRENPQQATIIVSVADPGIENVSVDTETLFITGDSISVRPTSLTVDFNGVTTAGSLEAVVDVFQGVFGFPTISGVPSSPTADTNATVTIGGDNVDYYRYRLNSDPWSGEIPVSQSIELTGLSGVVQLAVSGRSRYGSYHSDSEAVTVSWTVDTGAPAISITGTPETPTRETAATLYVEESSYYCYRIDGGAYQPDAGAGSPIVLARLTDGEHAVEVLPRVGSGGVCPGDGAGTIARWTVERLYGLDFPMEKRVRHESLGQIDGNPTAYVWDGRDDSGIAVAPGWYSVKITVIDGLGRAGSTVKLVYVGDLVADGLLLSDGGIAGQKEAHAFGKWVVWQDQRYGNWDVFAMDLTDQTGTPILVAGTQFNQERPRTDGTYVVWEDRQADGSWDIWAKRLDTADEPFAITATPNADERKPAVCWPWVVYQTKPVAVPSAPWQLTVYHMIEDRSETIDATTQDQLDPWVHQDRVVWQDFRDAGPGEIYLKNLKTGDVRRITHDSGGQYHPVIYEQWIVWADNRNGQFDLYGYNLLRGMEIQLTATPENETWPMINGKWVVCTEDAMGGADTNIRLLSLSNLAAIQMTSTNTEKERPCLASGKLIWADNVNGLKQITIGSVPDLQPVFRNHNTVAVTEGMASELQDGFTLLELWNQEAGVTAITRYTSLVPTVESDTLIWDGNQPTGNNFSLEAGTFLWVRFGQTHILDLGYGACSAVDLVAGVNVLTYTCFPDQYTAYDLIGEIGTSHIIGLRMLDADTGRWRVASVVGEEIVGENFAIPRIAVVMMDTKNAIMTWKPGE